MGSKPVKDPAFERKHPRNHGRFAKKYGLMMPASVKHDMDFGVTDLYSKEYDTADEALDDILNPENRLELNEGVELHQTEDGTYMCDPNPGFGAKDVNVDLYMDGDRYDPDDAFFDTTPQTPDDFKLASTNEEIQTLGLQLEPVNAFRNGRTSSVTLRAMPVTPWRSSNGSKADSQPVESEWGSRVVVCAWDGAPQRLADRQLHNIQFMTGQMQQMGAIPKDWTVRYDTTVNDADGTTILRPIVSTPGNRQPDAAQWRQVRELISQVTQGLTSATSKRRGEGILADEPELAAADPWA